MKPRNKLERDLQAAIDGGVLRPLSAKQMQHAHRLMDKNTYLKDWVFNAVQTTKGMRLTKCYRVHRYGRGSVMTYYHLCLIRAERDGKVAWAARPCVMCYADAFSNESPITIKSERSWYNWYITKRPVLRSVGTPEPYAVVREHYQNQFEFRDPRIETLAACGGEAIIANLMATRKALKAHTFAAFKVANRHGYKFGADTWRWMYLFDMLHDNKMDYRSPHYICPADLNAAYSRMIDIDDKRRHELLYKRVDRLQRLSVEEIDKRNNERYLRSHRKWLGIVIKGKDITIAPLQSIDDFKAEANAMHHCVYNNEYYKKRGSLILSARDKSGKRLATIEYDIKHLVVLQCRAACNKHPEQYDKIISLMRRHKGDFRTSGKAAC